jgi:hypothetical protein
MSSSSTQPDTPRRPDEPRANVVRNALVWLAAIAPFPWWW